MKIKSREIIISSAIILSLTVAILLFVSFTPLQQAEKWIAPPSADKVINPTIVNDQTLADAKILFTKNCEQCHGKKGRGDGPKSAELDKQVGDMTTKDFISQTDGAIYWKITNGRKPMPSFKKEMTDEQRWRVIFYVRELGKPKSKK
jgi:mono/diheme cytochrome c family protein